jgi:hypothetical protein
MKTYLITNEAREPVATGIPGTFRFRVAQEWANELEEPVYIHEQPGDTLVVTGIEGEGERVLPRVD